MTTGKTNNNISDKDLIHLADEFSRLEGRRPRILVTLTDNNLSSQFNGISSSLADLGFDVDIAPRFMSYESLSRQAIENDVHALLVLSHDASVNILIANIIKDLEKYKRSDIMLLIKTNLVRAADVDDRNEGLISIFGSEIETADMAKHMLNSLIERQ